MIRRARHCRAPAPGGELRSEVDRFEQASAVSPPGAGEIERRAVIDRSANHGKPRRHVVRIRSRLFRSRRLDSVRCPAECVWIRSRFPRKWGGRPPDDSNSIPGIGCLRALLYMDTWLRSFWIQAREDYRFAYCVGGRAALIPETLSTPAILHIGCEKSAAKLGTGTRPM
jgi:hypothetical protein